MMQLGFLFPDGTLHQCESYDHLSKAAELCESLYNKSFMSTLDAENYLLSEIGAVCVRARDVYAHLGVRKDGRIVCISDEQKHWLEQHYAEMNDAARESVDDLLKESSDWLYLERRQRSTSCSKCVCQAMQDSGLK